MLSIIVVNYKNPPLLRLFLKSMARVLPQSFSHEIIVVDVAATLETEHVVKEEFPLVRYLPFTANIGYTRGVNEGISASRGDAVFIANSDIIPLPGALEELYRYLQKHPQVGIIGPQLLNFDGSRQQSCFRFYTPWTIVYRRTFLGRLPWAKKTLDRFQMKDHNLSEITPCDWLMGSAYMVSKKAIQTVGPMDEKLFLYFSDVDWPRRFWENGYQVIFYPRVSMYHYHRRESRGAADVLDVLLNKQTRWHIRDGLRYFFKYGFMQFSNV